MLILSAITCKGIIVRSKEQHMEEGEKCTRYFLKKIINSGDGIFKLKKTNGEQTNIDKEIMEEVEGFYRDLYSEKQIENEAKN